MNTMQKEIMIDKIYHLIAENPRDILLIKEKYITDDLWIFAIRMDASLFAKVKKPSLKVCYAGIESDGMNLKYVKKAGYEITAKMALTAIKNTPAAIYLIPKTMWSDELLELVCDMDPSFIKEFHLKDSYLKRKIKENPSIIQYIKNPTEEQQIMAIKESPYCCTYIKDPSSAVLNVLYEEAPEIYEMRFKTLPTLTDE